VDKLGGRATIYFNKDNQVPVDRKSEAMGGVYVGSGADGVAVTTNADPSAPVVVHPPLVPRMSITVVGGGLKFCVYFIPKNENGSMKKFGAQRIGCNNPGAPVRVRQAGTYFIKMTEYDPADLGRNFIELSEGENKIIPLRRIEIPPTNARQISFNLYEDFETSESQRELLMKEEYVFGRNFQVMCEARPSLCRIHSQIEDFASFRKEFEQFASGSADPLQSTWAQLFIRFPEIQVGRALRTQYFDSLDEYPQTNPGRTGGGSDPIGTLLPHEKQTSYTYYVLPGVFGVKWSIENSPDVTKGIYVP
jgi:hypothetical protein